MMEIIIGTIIGAVFGLACQLSYHKGYMDALDWTAQQRGHKKGGPPCP